jgi:hypothetical protein
MSSSGLYKNNFLRNYLKDEFYYLKIIKESFLDIVELGSELEK